MRHLKLYENFRGSFNSYDLPNFRLELVNPDMQEKMYLLTCVDGSWNSFYGVFDLRGLKNLEDAMNTECVFAELVTSLLEEDPDKEGNPALEAHTTIIINPVDSDVKWLNLLYRPLEEVPIRGKVSAYSNPRAGLQIGKEGLGLENFVHGTTVTVSKSPQKDPETGKADSYPIVLNQLHYADHHWSSRKETKDYEYALDDSIGFRKYFLEMIEYKKADKKAVDPYMSSIIDAGIPKGVIKTLKEMQKIEPKDPEVKMVDSREKAFYEESGFKEMLDELEKALHNYQNPIPIEGNPGSQERLDSLERIMQRKRQILGPLFKQTRDILERWKSRIPKDLYDNNLMYLETRERYMR